VRKKQSNGKTTITKYIMEQCLNIIHSRQYWRS